MSCCGDTCGAMKANGERCKHRTLSRNGRCKWHGGKSTGPKTAQGRNQSRINGAKGGRPAKLRPNELSS